MKFSQMKYEHPNIDAVKKQLTDLAERFRRAEDYESARSIFLEREQLEKHIMTLFSLVEIRHSIDTRDKFYEEEMNFWNSVTPELEEYNQEWTKAMLESSYRSDFENEYGTLMFLKAEM